MGFNMKIAIDTKEDSREDMRKVISLLQHIVGESSNGAIFSNRSSDIFSDSSSGHSSEPSPEPSSSGSGAFFNMFGDNSPSPPETSDEPSLLGPETETREEEDKDDDIPEIIAY